MNEPNAIPNGLIINSQIPLNQKLIAETINDLKDLGENNFKAFIYYDKIVIFCKENEKYYVWKENINNEQGLLNTDFQYPNNFINFDIDYSNKFYNFFEITNDKNYVHNQTNPSSIWNINHNLNKFPSVTIVDSANSVVIGDIEFVDLNNLKVSFNGNFSGKAILN